MARKEENILGGRVILKGFGFSGRAANDEIACRRGFVLAKVGMRGARLAFFFFPPFISGGPPVYDKSRTLVRSSF